MSTMEETIEIDVPVSTAYNQWTQFEEFPKFMEGVREVRQLDDTHLHWRAEIGGKEEEWDAEITEQVPDTRIAWRSTGGVQNSGTVSFMTYLMPGPGSSSKWNMAQRDSSKKSGMRSVLQRCAQAAISGVSRNFSNNGAKKPVPGEARFLSTESPYHLADSSTTRNFMRRQA